jgi:hypothetical protein
MRGPRSGSWGHAGIRALAWAPQVSETTVRKGVDESDAGEELLAGYAGSVVGGGSWTMVKSSHGLSRHSQ